MTLNPLDWFEAIRIVWTIRRLRRLGILRRDSKGGYHVTAKGREELRKAGWREPPAGYA